MRAEDYDKDDKILKTELPKHNINATGEVSTIISDAHSNFVTLRMFQSTFQSYIFLSPSTNVMNVLVIAEVCNYLRNLKCYEVLSCSHREVIQLSLWLLRMTWTKRLDC